MPSRSPARPNAAKEGAILREAVHVFARDGFRGTDVQEIADRANVGKGTVYRYFGDKQELFWATVFWVLHKLDVHLASAAAGERMAMDKLRATCHAYGEFFEIEFGPGYFSLPVPTVPTTWGKIKRLYGNQ